MARQFQIGELRTLVARALQASNYAPAVSARVRAVPDTRTIRYYTTLGLLSPPAEMRGRVAYYDETHVLQIVAIKQLQAQNLSLSDIQQRFLGLTPRMLEAIAKLPTDFWEVADKYLASQAERKRQSLEGGEKAGSEEWDPSEFWLSPAALPSSSNEPQSVSADAKTITVIRFTLSNGLKIAIELPPGTRSKQKMDMQSLLLATNPIVEELRRQNLPQSKSGGNFTKAIERHTRPSFAGQTDVGLSQGQRSWRAAGTGARAERRLG